MLNSEPVALSHARRITQQPHTQFTILFDISGKLSNQTVKDLLEHRIFICLQGCAGCLPFADQSVSQHRFVLVVPVRIKDDSTSAIKPILGDF